MKQIKYYVLIFLMMAVFTIVSFAQLNYQCAIEEARHCEGTDADIHDVMCKYGFFDEDGYGYKPNIIQKIKALYAEK